MATLSRAGAPVPVVDASRWGIGVALVLLLAAVAGCRAATPAAPSAAVALTASTADEVHGYHRDAAHSGYDPATPPAGALRVAWRAQLDGKVYAATLVVGGLAVAATEHNSVYGVHLDSGRLAWARHLGSPVPQSALPCGNIDPLGITGSPAYDTFTHQVFVVTTTRAGTTLRHTLVGLDPATGAVRSSRVVDPPGQDPLVENQRGALALSRGRVLVTFGGHAGDCGSYHGWLVSAPTNGQGALAFHRVTPNGGAGLWQPSGAVADSSGNVYVVTGNGTSGGGAWDGSNAVIKLDPVTLRTLSSFAPADWAQGNANDADLGSAGAALVGGRVWTQGKSARGYLLDQAALGGVGHYVSTTTGVCAEQFGGPAVHGSTVFAPCTDGLRQLRVGADGSLNPGWRAPSAVTGSPVVGGGEVWSLATGSGVLYALDEATGAVHGSVGVGAVSRFATPTLSGSLVLVPTQSGVTAVAGA